MGIPGVKGNWLFKFSHSNKITILICLHAFDSEGWMGKPPW